MAVIDQRIEKNYAIYNGDCIEGMAAPPEESIALSVYSPPFGGLYHYSSNERDLSNCRDYDQFFDHYAFVVRELARITMPGRMTAVHCMDVPTGNSGTDALIDFPGDIIRLHEREGWRYICALCDLERAARGTQSHHGKESRPQNHRGRFQPLQRRQCRLFARVSPTRGKQGSDRASGGASGIRGRAEDSRRIAIVSRVHRQPNRESFFALDLEAVCVRVLGRYCRIGRVLPFRDAKDPDERKARSSVAA